MAEFLLLKKGRFLNFAFTFIASFFLVATGWGQTVTTDRDDYSPGQYVIVTGTGWEPGETVSFDFHETPKVCSTDHHFRSTVAKEDGSILYDQYLINEKHLGVAFVLTATGQLSGSTAVTHFTDAGIKGVSVVGTSFCAGQNITVSFEAVANLGDPNYPNEPNGNFNNNNIFYLHLSDSNGNFPSSQAVTDNNVIGQAGGKANNTFTITNALIPPNTPSGSNYKIRVVSSLPTTNAPVNNSNLTISAIPTISDAGADQLDVSGTSTTLAANAPTVGTGAWSIVRGTGGSIGSASNPTSTFSGVAGSTYDLRWTVANGACTSTDDVTISFSSIIATTTTLASTVNPSIYTQTLTFTATVAPSSGTNIPTGNVIFKNGSDVLGTVALSSVNDAQRAIFSTSALSVKTSGHSITAVYEGAGNFQTSTSDAVNQVVNKAPATVTLSGLTGQVYNGSTKRVTATTDPEGLAVEFTYNGSATEPTNAGSYTIVGTINNVNYQGSATGTLVIGKAATETVVTIAAGPFTYTGEAITPATVRVTGAGGLDFTAVASYSNNTNAGTATASYSYAETANYLASLNSKSFTISQAAAVITVTPYDVTYNGESHTSAFTAVGVESTPVDLTSLMDVTGTTHTNAATYNGDSWSFAGNTNYAATSGTVDNNISQAAAVITVTPYDVTYNGESHTSAFTAVGVESTPVDLTSLMDVTGTTHTNAATYNGDSWSFAGNTNYAATSGTVDNNISQAAAVITVTPYDVTYNGESHTSAFTAVGVESTPVDLTSLMDVTGTTHTNAATYNGDSWSFAGNTNYAATSGTVDNNISQAAAVITVTPYDVTYNGESHTSAFTAVGVESTPVDLTSLMDVTGTTHTNAATYNGDSWSFAGNTNYAATSGTVDNNISQAAAVITVTPYDVTYNGESHTSAFTAVGVESTPVDLTSLMDVTGTTHTNAATYNGDSWSFAGNTNYAATSGTVDNNISQAAAVITVTPYDVTYNGESHTSAFTAVGVESTPVDLTSLMDVTGTTHTNAATYNGDSWSFAGNTNYAATSGTVDNNISQAAAVITVTPYDVTYNGESHTSAFTAVGVESTPVDLTSLMDVTGTTHTNAATYNGDSWSFAGNTNYAATSGTVDNNISQAAAVITVTPYDVTYNGESHTSAFTAVGVESTPVDLTSLMDVTGTTHTNAATYNGDSWSFAGNTNYAATSGTVDNNISQAAAVISVTPYDVTYNGESHTSAFTAVGVESTPVDLTSLMDVTGTTHTNAATYNGDSWSFAGNTNYAATSGTVDNNISQAAAVISVTPYDVTYNGESHTSAFTAVGVESTPVDLTSLMDVTGTTHTNAATYNGDSWSFAGNTNYAATSGTVDNNISQAAAVITVTPYDVTYNGESHTSAFTAVGVESTPVDLTSLMDVTGTTHTNAATYNGDSWSFAGNTNYAATSGTVDNNISQAAAVITVTPYDVTYNGESHTSAFTAVGVESTPVDLTSLMDVTGTTHTNAATYNGDSWSFAGNTNYAATSGTVDNNISQAAAVITVTPYDVTYNGESHTSAFTAVGVESTPVDLTSLMDVTGTTHTNAATYNGDSWSFAGNTNYAATSGTVDNNISQAAAVITVTPYDVTYNGESHTSAFTAVGVESTPVDLTSLMDVTGTTHTNAATYNGDSWSFAGNTNYAATSGTVDNNISQAAAVITVTPYDVTYNGESHTSAFTAVGVESTPVDLTSLMDVTGTTHTNAATYNGDSWSFAGNTNYAATSGTVDNNISQAAAVITVTPYDVTYNGESHTSAFTAVGVESTPVDLTSLMDVTGTTHTNAATYNGDSWSFAGNTNYAATSGTVDNNISQAAAVITVTPYDVTYNGESHTSAFTAVGVESTPVDLTSLMDVTGTTHTNAATYNGDSWSFAGNTNYAATSGTVDNNISQAAAVITVTPYDVTYNGESHTSAFTAVGVESTPVDLTSLMDVTGTIHTNAATYNGDGWSFAGNTNYAATSGTVDNNISQRSVTITPNTNQSKYCAQADATFTYTSSETLLSGNTFTGKLGREAGEGVGSYAYNIGSLSAGGNYSLTLVGNETYKIKGVAIEASASSTAQPLYSTNAPLSATVVDQAGNPVYSASVTFTVSNNAGVTLKILSGIPTNSLGNALTTVDASTWPIGVYTVKAVAGSGCADSYGYLTLYDPNSDFVTGGGWINSPEGAYVADPSISGKANFGFVAKYKKGRAEVDGNTEFQFKAGNFNFKSGFHNSGSLVVSGAKATYRGEGTVNGLGNYGFMVSAYDGAINGSSGGSDKFRIKIWDISAGNAVVYDNKLGALDNADISGDLNLALGGGSIVIHQFKVNNKTAEVVEKVSITASVEPVVEILESMAVAPNPVREEARVRFSLIEDASVVLRVFDFNGREVERLFSGSVRAHEVKEVSFQRRNLMSGVYILKLTTDRGNSYDKQIIVE